MKKLLAIVLSLVLLLSAFPFAALAEELSLARRPEQSEGSPSDDAILSEVQAESKDPLPEDLTNTLPSIAENMAINSGTCGNNLSWSFNTTTGVLTITGTGEMDDYDFGIDGSSSTAPWVSLSNEISSVIIGDDVETIGECAFLYCENLTSVTFGNSVTSIGKYAFYQCALYEVNLSESVTLIGEYAFCNNVGDSMSVVIPGGVTLIGEDAFAYCPLNEVTICDGVSTIGRSAFAFDMDLSSIVLPGSVTEIEPAAFYYCTSLESITIPNSVTSIGDYAFTDCENLATVNYGGTQEQWDAIVIGDENEPLLNAELVLTSQDNPAESVWQYEISDGEATLTGYTGAGGAVTIPSSLGGYPVTAIGCGAFYTCTGLTSITIPDSVTAIGEAAFYYCTGLTSITIPDSVTTIGENAFYDCTGLTGVTIGNGVTAIGEYAFYGCTGLTEITIPDSVTTIGKGAFSYCTGLTEITIPDSVTTIGNDAFSYCTGLTSITVAEGNPVYHSEGNCLIETASKTLIAGCKNSVIPNDGSVTCIGERAFCGCIGLTEITIPDSVTSIGEWAFSGCAGLTEITIPDSVTSIGRFAFWCCTGLTSVTIPDSVTSIDDYAFGDCFELKTVYYGGTQEQWDAIVIGDENEPLLNAELVLTSQDNPAESVWQYEISDGEATLTGYTGAGGAVTIPSSLGGCPVTAIGVSAFSGCSSVSAIIIPNSVTTIGKNAFEGTGITTITIPKSVSSMSGSFWDQWETKYYSALNGASALREVIFEEGLKTIPEYALFGCSQVTRVVIPDSVTSIGGRAFNNCSGLTSLVIPDSVSSIDYVRVSSYGAPRMATIIDGCTSLKSVVIGNGVKIINASAFSRLTSLESVIIGSGVVSIGPSAFYECTSLSNVVIPDSVASIGNDAFYGCTGLTSITISDSVASIGNGAFSGCTALQRISTPFWNPNFGSDLTSLSEITVTGDSAENFAFDGYGALEKITVTAWEKVPMYAFSNCASLKEVVLPASLTKIANYAFSYSEAIETVRFAGTREQWDRIEIGVKGNDPLYNAALICEGDQTGPITTVTELTILTTPAKTTYDRNEPLDLTGMELEATYSDGSRVPVTDGYLVNGFDYKPGEKTITVIYGGASTTFTVTVRDPASPELLDQPGIIVSSAQVKPGEAFTVTVSIHDNPGISVLSAKPVYNRAFTLVSAVNGTVFTELTGGNTQLIFDALDGTSSENGTLVTLTFRAPDTDYSASFDFDLIVSAINEKEQNVALPVLPGIVELVGTLWGDANGDGKVDNKDIVRLKNYVANYDDETGISTNGTTVYTLSPGADANGDGKVDNKDIVRLKNYIANYDDTTGISSNGTTTYILGPAA